MGPHSLLPCVCSILPVHLSFFGAVAQPCTHGIRTLREGRRRLQRRVLLFAGDLPGLRRGVRPLSDRCEPDRGRVRRRNGPDGRDLRRSLGGRDGPRPRVRRDRPGRLRREGDDVRRRAGVPRRVRGRARLGRLHGPARLQPRDARRRRPRHAKPVRCRASALAWSGRPDSSSRRSWHDARKPMRTPGDWIGRGRASARRPSPSGRCDFATACAPDSPRGCVAAIGRARRPAAGSLTGWQGPR